MRVRVLSLVLVIILSGVVLAGCAAPGGAFARTEERVVNVAESIQNIALDGDGVN